MALIQAYNTVNGTTFQLTSVNGAGTPITQSFRGFPITGYNSANTNWGNAGFGQIGTTANGLFGTTVPTFTNGLATGTMLAYANPTATGGPTVNVTWRLNIITQTLTFEPTTIGDSVWIAFVFDDPLSTAFTFDDSGWNVSLLGAATNGLSGLAFFWGRQVTHNAGSLIGNSNGNVTASGFNYNITPNLQANNAVNWIISGQGSPNTNITTYNSTLNWNGCTIRSGAGALRCDMHFIFPFTANIRNMTFTNAGNIAVPNFTLAANNGVIDGISALRVTFCPGNPLTAGNVIPTRLITGSTSGFGDRQQPLSSSQFTDFTALAAGGGLTNPAWISHRLNLRTGTGVRSLIPRIDNGWRFLDTNGVPITTAYTNFYSTTSSTPRNSGGSTAGPFHQFEINYVGALATHVYEKVFQCRYLVSPANPDGSLKPNTLISFTNGDLTNATRTRYIPRYVIASGLMSRPFPVNATDTVPQIYLVTVLGQEVLASALYLYGKVDTTATSGFFGNFTPAYTDTNTLSPATGGNVTYDPTPVQVVWFDKWGSRLASRSQTALNSQVTTTLQVVLPEDAYIKLADDTPGTNTNRLLAQGLNLTITQTGGVNTSISAITIGAAMDGNDFYAGLEAWSRNIVSNGYLRPIAEWSDPNALGGILIFVVNVNTLNVNGAIGTWTPTAGKAAINRIQLFSPTGTVTFAAGTVATTTTRFDANTINVGSQTIVNGSLNATTAITNLVSNGAVVNGSAFVGFGTNSAITMTDNLSFNIVVGGSLTGSLALTPGVAGRTVAFFGATAGNLAGFTLTNTTPGTTIGLNGWPLAVPNGFTSDLTVQITINFTTPLTSVADLKVVECYLDSNTTTTNIGTPSLANAGTTVIWTFIRSVSSTMNIVVFAERNRPVAGRTSGQNLVLTAAAEDNVDFAPLGTQPANFTAFVTGSSVTQGSWTFAGSKTGIIFGFTVISYDPLTSTWAKYTLRRIMENANVTTIAWRRGIALGTNQIPQGVFVFTPVGTTLVNINFYAKGAKQSISSTTPVLFESWNTDSGGVLSYDWNQDITDGNQRVIYPILSPGASVNLTSYTIALITEANRQTNLPYYNTLSTRINQASLLIPSDTTPLT